MPTCYRLVVYVAFLFHLLWTCHLRCGLAMGKSPTCYRLAVMDFGL